MEWFKPDRCIEQSNWHFWFAWHPVTIKTYPDGTRKKVWLKTIMRKGEYDSYVADDALQSFWTWKYAYTKKDFIAKSTKNP